MRKGAQAQKEMDEGNNEENSVPDASMDGPVCKGATSLYNTSLYNDIITVPCSMSLFFLNLAYSLQPCRHLICTTERKKEKDKRHNRKEEEQNLVQPII